MKLVKPEREHLESLETFRHEFIQADSSMDGGMDLKDAVDLSCWLDDVKAMETTTTCPIGFVPHTLLLYLDETTQEIIGIIQVRHELNDYLSRIGGHIGYSIRPTMRRKGYASQMLKDIKPICKELGLDNVLVTCLKNNEGSRRVILNNGGVYESEVYDIEREEYIQRYWLKV